jgi:uncharacterized SAM-binding protein YcdF (DUF218 family)
MRREIGNAMRKDRPAPARRYRARTAWRMALAVFSVAVAGCLVMFVQFTGQMEKLSSAGKRATADAIVVLTGDRARIAKAIELLQAGRGERLLISGVNERTSRATLRSMIANAGTRFDCCVDIDRAALDTIGNARQASIWVQERGFGSLIVVTSDYHLPRSLIEFRRAMPGIAIYPVSANSGGQTADAGWDRYRTLAQEFLKYLAAQLHLGERQSTDGTEIAASPQR